MRGKNVFLESLIGHGISHIFGNPGTTESPILDALLNCGDNYRHLADLTSYAEAHKRLGELYTNPEAWTRKAILNIAASGRFSSDRTIAEYARGIWNTEPLLTE